MSEPSQDLHPDVARLAEAIVIREPVPESVLAAHIYAKTAARIRAGSSDPVFLGHLVVMWWRLSQMGLKAAAAQFLALARLGLSVDEVRDIVERVTGSPTEAARLGTAPEKTLAPKSPQTSGVRLHRRKP